MTQVKICGITNEEDALCAAQCGADALGFIFYPSSPRYVAPDEALRIIQKLPAHIVRVGVFVNEPVAEVKRICQLCNLNFIQLHGDESVEYCRAFTPESIIKAVELSDESDLQKALNYQAAAVLVDSRAEGLYGGTGKKSNWDLALKLKSKKPLILSGGLNENNVREALEKVAPCALDINSGVEIKPGKKDHKKLAGIFDIIRSAAAGHNEMELIFTKRGR
ncbi:MAG: phosphoribosylanthranilate isomerase [Smithellaceae bacterium]